MSRDRRNRRPIETPNRRTFLQIAAAASAVGLAGCQVETNTTRDDTARRETDTPDPAELDTEAIPLEEVPVDAHRLAVREVADAIRTGLAPDWTPTGFAETVEVFYRPDVDGPAYYEFTVEPEGFVIVSTGKHDDPVPHWNHRGPSISGQLATETEEHVGRLYKLDTLYYVAESPDGERVAEQGYRLPRVEGLEADMREIESIRTYEPAEEVPSDENLRTPIEDEQISARGPEELDIELVDWESWEEMKTAYAEAYALQLEWLREGAQENWEVHEDFEERGRGLAVGRLYQEPLLYPNPEYEVVGPGSEYVQVRPSEGEPWPGYLSISVEEPPEELQFEIHIAYPTGQEERRLFAIGPEIEEGQDVAAAVGAPGGVSLGYGAATNLAAAASGAPNLAAAASDWDTWYAGYSNDQCEYRQFTHDGCPIGCGPVAWAMLFGWADRKAETTNYWEPRFGIFREDVAESPAPNDVAPTSMTSDARKMIRLIHDEVDTYCLFGGGATNPWNMFDAYEFLKARTGTGMRTRWVVPGAWSRTARRRARDQIWGVTGTNHHGDSNPGTPAVIGTGIAPAHYPLAWGYARKETSSWNIFSSYHRRFYVNQGWGDCCYGWISARTWFAGEIFA